MAASSASHLSALAETRRALELRPDWEMAALLQAQLLSRTSPSEAVSSLQGFVERNSKARDAQRIWRAGWLAKSAFPRPGTIFDQLLQSFPNNPEVVYPAAILALQQNDRALAETHFTSCHLEHAGQEHTLFLSGANCRGKQAQRRCAGLLRAGWPGRTLHARPNARAHLLADMGQLDAARRQLSTAKATTPEDRVQLVIAEAGLLREAKQPQAAFDLLEKRWFRPAG